MNPLSGSFSRLHSFSIWQYGISRPALWPSQMIDGSRVSSQRLRMCTKGASQPQASMPVTRTPREVRYKVASRPMPQPAVRYFDAGPEKPVERHLIDGHHRLAVDRFRLEMD